MHHHSDRQSQQPAANKTINIIRTDKHVTETDASSIAVDRDNPVCATSFCLYFTIWLTNFSLLLPMDSVQ